MLNGQSVVQNNFKSSELLSCWANPLENIELSAQCILRELICDPMRACLNSFSFKKAPRIQKLGIRNGPTHRPTLQDKAALHSRERHEKTPILTAKSVQNASSAPKSVTL